MRPSGAVPGRGVQMVGLSFLHDQIHRTHHGTFCPAWDVQDAVPGVAAILGVVDTAAKVVGIQFAKGGHPHAVGVDRVDDNASNVMGLGEPGMTPCLAKIVADVHPISRIGTP